MNPTPSQPHKRPSTPTKHVREEYLTCAKVDACPHHIIGAESGPIWCTIVAAIVLVPIVCVISQTVGFPPVHCEEGVVVVATPSDTN